MVVYLGIVVAREFASDTPVVAVRSKFVEAAANVAALMVVSAEDSIPLVL
jgi:hypothetical protein